MNLPYIMNVWGGIEQKKIRTKYTTHLIYLYNNTLSTMSESEASINSIWFL